MKDAIRLGVSLYSFSNEYFTRKLDLEGVLAKARELGFTGIEIVAAQMVPEYPYPSDEWLAGFRALLDRHGLEPVCWSAYIDMGIRSDRDLTEDEIVHFTMNDLICAKKAGFPLVRTQHAISPKIFRQFIPVCRELGVKLAIEMHHPHHPDVPVWREFLDLMRDEGDGWLGVVPDFSIFQRRPHRLFLEEALRMGCRRERLDEAVRLHAEGAALEAALAEDLLPAEREAFGELWHRFDHPARIGQIAEMMPVTPYIHGKFYWLEEGEDDPCIPYREILGAIRDAGFKGTIACEYEGHHFSTEVDTSVMLRRYVDMVRRMVRP